MLTDQPLNSGLNAAILAMCLKHLPHGFHASPDAPNTYEELCADYAAKGRVTVWDGASDRTIYGAGTAGARVNVAFRAWHDWRHLTMAADFTPQGEARTCYAQIGDLFDAYGVTDETLQWARIIQAEIIGQGRYLERNGDFPVDQMAFVKAFLVDKDAALNAAF